jgi:hypothetical protein
MRLKIRMLHRSSASDPAGFPAKPNARTGLSDSYASPSASIAAIRCLHLLQREFDALSLPCSCLILRTQLKLFIIGIEIILCPKLPRTLTAPESRPIMLRLSFVVHDSEPTSPLLR